jgi:EmrB/QacA subfamily drug resistance transporter
MTLTASSLRERSRRPLEANEANHKWWILAVVAAAQLMVVLDGTVVNIALPRAQSDLGFGDADRQWIVTSYALAFGALLLLGGRLGDVLGRKRVFVIGLTGFALASAVGGAAPSFGVLVGARAAQGVFGALLAPAALSLLAITFSDAAERARAFAIFGAIAGGGGAIGLILGGALTEWASWRWCLYVNLLVAVPALVLASKLLSGDRGDGRAKLDVPGAIAVSAALFSLVFGFSKAESDGWGSPKTIGFLAAGVVLLAAFVQLQRVVAQPLLPLRVVLARTRGGAFLAMLLSGAGMFAVFLFLTYFLQVQLGYSPIKNGLAFLPLILSLMVTAQIVARIITRTGPRPLMPVGMVIVSVGMLVFTQLGLGSGYATHILPGLILCGIGMGLTFAPGMQAAISGITPEDAGVASATVNTVQQIGGSVGTAIFSTISASSAASFLRSHPDAAAQASLHGYVTVFWASAGLFLLGAVVTALLLRSGPLQVRSDAAPVIAH